MSLHSLKEKLNKELEYAKGNGWLSKEYTKGFIYAIEYAIEEIEEEVYQYNQYQKAKNTEQIIETKDGDVGQVDMINHPPQYTQGELETIQVIERVLTPEQFRGFCRGNVLKYQLRAPFKGKQEVDYSKAKWYYDYEE